MKTECKNNSYNTFPSSIVSYKLGKFSFVQVYFFFIDIPEHILFIMHTNS